MVVTPHKSLSETQLLQLIVGALIDPLTGEIRPVTATSVAWGNITGALADQADLVAALAAVTSTWGNITGTLSDQTDLQAALTAAGALQTITLTGDVTGSGTASFAATIGAQAISLAKMANVATGTVFYRKSAGAGSPEIQTLGTLKTDLGLTGTNSGDQTISLTGDVTGSGVSSFAATIAAGVVTFAKLATSAWSDDTTLSGNSSTKLVTEHAAKIYADSLLQDFDQKDPVVAATTGPLPFSPTYANGSSGVGATLTGSVGVLAFDGYTPALNDRVLVKNEPSPARNGLYKVTTVGTVIVGYVLTRTTDFNQTANIVYGDTVGVLNGSVNANQQFTMNNNNVITVGTTSITWAQTSGGSQLIEGDQISIVGNTVAVDTSVDVTTNDVSTSSHGFAPKAPNDPSFFLSGLGVWGQILFDYNSSSIAPTYSNITGTTAATAEIAQQLKIGNIVTMSGKVTGLTFTAVASPTVIQFLLSNLFFASTNVVANSFCGSGTAFDSRLAIAIPIHILGDGAGGLIFTLVVDATMVNNFDITYVATYATS